MGACKFCGEPAGLLSSAHKECREAHQRACGSVTALLDSGLNADVPATGLSRSVQEVSASGRLAATELRKLVLSSMVRWIDNALSDHVLSHDEEKRLTDFTEAFNIENEDIDEVGYKLKLVKALTLRDLSEGQIPKRFKIEGPLPINLTRDESIIFVFQNAEYQKMNTRYHYAGRSSGTSVRLMKGVYLKSSGYKGERLKTDELQSVGKGHLIVTNKNVFFYGPEIVKMPLKKIAGVQPFTDGIAVFKDRENAKPAYFMLDDPLYAVNLISLASSLT